MKSPLILAVACFCAGAILSALVFNRILQAEHNSNRMMYNTLNKCDQSLKHVISVLDECRG